MIKKITVFLFSILLILLLIINVKANAESITILPKDYLLVNLGNDSYLTHPSLTIISGDVDWNKTGTYTITYEDYNKNIHKKDYVIIQNKNEQYFLENNIENEIPFANISEVEDVFYLSSESYYIIYNYQVEDPTYYDQEKVAVSFYENNSYKWTYSYYKYSRYVSGYLLNDNLIIAGKVYNENNNYNNSIVLFEITKEREIIKQREIESNFSCSCYGIHYYENYLYLVTSTKGNSLDYNKIKTSNEEQLVILKIDYESFKIYEGKAESAISNFRIIDTSFYDYRITINIAYKENIMINNVEYTNCIYEYDERLQLQNQYHFSLKNKDYITYQVTKNDVCFFSIDHSVNSEYVKVQYLNNEIDIKIIELSRENMYNINDIKVITVNENDIYMMLNSKKLNKKNFLGFAKINTFDGVKYFSVTPSEISVLNSKVYNNNIYNTYIKDNKLYNKIYNLIEIIASTFENSNYNITKKTVIVNGQKTALTNYFDNTNYKKYGIYHNVLKTKDGNNNAYYVDEIINVNAKVNVANNEVYQIGYKLCFNGEAILNGKKIKSDYIINDIGNYQLIIYGENVDEMTYYFDISDLTISSSIKQPVDFEIVEITNTNQVYKNKPTNTSTIEYNVKQNYSEVIPLVISILSFGILSFIMLRKKI